MWRIACVCVVLTAATGAAADPPPGALVRLGDDRFRAGGAVEHLALSPDGKQFATAQSASEGVLALTVWDAATGRPVREQRVNRELFRGLVWGPGGAFAVAARTEPAPGDKRGKVVPDDFRVWDFTDPSTAPPLLPPLGFVERTNGSILDGPPRPGAEYTHFHFSADGKRIAVEWESADEKFAVHVFELEPVATAAKLARVGTIDLGAEGADAVRFSADGKTLVTFRKLANPDREPGTEFVATVWGVARGKPWAPFRVRSTEQMPRTAFRLRPGRGPITHQLILAPDARSVYVVAEGEKVWGLDEAPLVLPFKERNPKRWRSVIRWPNEPGTEQRTFSDYGGSAFNLSGTVLVMAADRKTLVIDVTGGRELGRLEGHAWTPSAVAVSADGTVIATADLFGLVRLWNAKTLRPLHPAPGHRAPVEYAELSPDGKRLLTWADDETVRLWDVATGTELRAFTGAPGVPKGGSRGGRPTFTPDGTAVLFGTKDRLVSRDLITGLEVPLPGALATSKPRYAVFAPDGKAVLTWADDDPPVAVYDWPSGKRRFELDPDGPVQPAGFSADGSAVFAGVCEPKRWDAKTGKELRPVWPERDSDDLFPLLALRPHAALVRAPREGKVRAIGAASDTAFPPASDEMRTYAAWGIAPAPDGRQFAVAPPRDAKPALVCESATGQVRRSLDGHRGEVRVLGFTPDGTRLLTAGGDHTVLVWDVRLQNVPLPDALKKETDAAKLWKALDGGAKDAYLAMARLAREPDAAVKLARMTLKPIPKGERGPDGPTDARAVELLEALDTDDARKLLKELAEGEPSAFRTQEAKRGLERLKAVGYNLKDK